MELSKVQKEAVEYLGSPTLVSAGAGSGKTRTLTAKIIYLISQGYNPANILAITFTNKAAEEMKTRLVKQTGIPSHQFPWVRTYHSACFKILKTNCNLMGYSYPIQVLSTYQQQEIIKKILIQINCDKKHLGVISSIISNAKNTGNPEAYFDKKPNYHQFKLMDIYREYEKELKSKNAVDFDNILLLTRNLLKNHDEIREKYQNLFQYILVDEYQDTNNLQEELTKLLMKNGNLFCVGDDWQAIYGFRGSNLNHFLSFSATYASAKVFRLEQNYRSANKIVEVANRLIAHNKNRMKKKCFSEISGGEIECYGFYDEEEEADWVSRKIKSLHKIGIPYDQMAVLYRTRFCSYAFEKCLRLQGIPYRMLGAKGFFERKEILDINSYLTAAVFEKDDISFERILNIPKRGIGPAIIKKIEDIRNEDMSLKQATRMIVKQQKLSKKITNELEMLLDLLDTIKKMSPKQAIVEMMNRTNYMEYLKEYSIKDKMDFTYREENIQQLLYLASQKETVEEYIEEAVLINEDREDNEKGVNLATVHASKGLEFEAVFVVACEENLFPHWKSIEQLEGLQEERRLLYVAITRASQYLYLTYAESRKGQYSLESRFLKELKLNSAKKN